MFQCPYLNVQITKPCEAKSCSAHIRDKKNLNCMFQYVVNTGEPNLGQISFLKDIPYSELKERYESALKKIQERVIKSELELDIPICYLMSNKICCISDTLIENPVTLSSGHTVDKDSIKYHKNIANASIKFLTTEQRLMEIIIERFPLRVIDKLFNLPNGTSKILKKKFEGETKCL